MIKLLRKHGTDPTITDPYFGTAAEMAAKQEGFPLELLELLKQ